MRPLRTAAGVAAITAAGVAGVALASGGQVAGPPADPPANAIVATGSAQRAVAAPARRSDTTIERALSAARARAMPAAVAAARREAAELAAAAGLRAGPILGIRRDVGPAGFVSGDEGRFGPGTWCGRTFAGRRDVRQPDGTTRRVSRFRHRCHVPRDASLRVTATFAVGSG